MLVVNNVSKKYGSFCALKDINLEFNNGVYALLAPNGAGKTTLIKLLTTLIFPTSGEILYKGTDIVSLDGEYRDIIGYLPQDFGYYRNYTPRKFLLYLAALKGIKKEDAVEKVKEVLKVVSLENVENKKMKGFSGGMIQRVGIAQALLNDPKILILDEPTAGLDPKERVRFRNLLSDLSRDRIVISTLDGMVYETSITFEESKEFRKKYILLSEKQDGGIMKARFISQGNNDEKWVRVNPNIEDVFLYQYRDEELEG